MTPDYKPGAPVWVFCRGRYWRPGIIAKIKGGLITVDLPNGRPKQVSVEPRSLRTRD